MKNHLIHVSFFVLWLLTGCSKEEIGTSVVSDILVDTRMENGNIIIDAETEKIYPQTRHTIKYSKSKTFHTFKINFTEIEEGGVLDQPGPAGTSINLGKLDKDEYTVKFYSMGKTTKATLTVKDTTALLKFEAPGNVRLR